MPVLHLREIASPVGPLTLGVTDEGVCLCEFNGRRAAEGVADLERLTGFRAIDADHPLLERLVSELTRYFAGELRTFTVPLHLPGTEFQRRVWDQLLCIGYGKTCSYLDVAVKLGNPNAVRAVGLANGQNRVAILVPCHRVIDKSGSLRGYGGGLERKKFLLELEGAIQHEGLLYSTVIGA
jgi:AraC family transcriptional regulator of adaptative response/methylated-DNA-[protein]-cysteine methyltransferase